MTIPQENKQWYPLGPPVLPAPVRPALTAWQSIPAFIRFVAWFWCITLMVGVAFFAVGLIITIAEYA